MVIRVGCVIYNGNKGRDVIYNGNKGRDVIMVGCVLWYSCGIAKNIYLSLTSNQIPIIN